MLDNEKFDEHLNEILKKDLSETHNPLNFLVNQLGIDYEKLSEYYNNTIIDKHEKQTEV